MISLIGFAAGAVLLILLSMLFSISESSFLAMNKLRLRILRQKKDKRALRTGSLLDKKEILINTLLIANDLVNILLSSIIAAASLKLFGEKGVGLAVFFVTLLILIFGEITPKTLSAKNPDSIAYSLSLFVKVTFILMRPAALIFTAFAKIVLKILGINISKPKQTYTQEEIKSFIDAGGESGILESGEKNMMDRVFRFTDLEAKAIMVPRPSIKAIPDTLSYQGILKIAENTAYSSFPVYKNNLDNIIGILYLKDLLKIEKPETEFKIERAVRRPLFIPGTKKMTSILQMLNENRQTSAIVIDEYSGTYGLLTISDIYREIFGTSENNRAWRKSRSLTELKGKTDFIIDGSILLIELKELTGVQIDSAINDTLGGWITEKIGDIPEKGNCVTIEDYSFTVEEVENRRVKKVHAVKIE